MDESPARTPETKPPGLKIPFLAKVLVVLSRGAIGALLGGFTGVEIARAFNRREAHIYILAGMILGALVVTGFWDRIFSRWYDHPGGR